MVAGVVVPDYASSIMALEVVEQGLCRFEPGFADVHMHPRIFDAITPDQFIDGNQGEGKAGLGVYTEAAARSGFTTGVAMLNEQVRRLTPDGAEPTELLPYAVFRRDQVLAVEAAISTQALHPMAVNLCLDPEDTFTDAQKTQLDFEKLGQRFADVVDDVVGLKIFGDASTGGFNVDPKFIPDIVWRWSVHNPEKPAVLHLEDENVGRVLRAIAQMPHGNDARIHIAHVSSQIELEAVIEAKERGMNVTDEATPHHLSLTGMVREELGGYGCMKPTLKKRSDIDFMWANLRYIDAFASDCAPHRTSDKRGEKPAFGVTNHSSMIPFFLGAIQQGKMTIEDLYQKLCIAPRAIYNLPEKDASSTTVQLDSPRQGAAIYESQVSPGYAPNNIFARTGEFVLMVGKIVEVRAGMSHLNTQTGEERLVPSYTHMLRPATMRAA